MLAWLLAALFGGTGLGAAYAQVAAGALPSGGQVVVGSGQLQQRGNLLVVQQSSARLGLDWHSFNIGSGATVEFRQPDAGAIALNRVLGNDASQIYGSLKANGQAFLTNPNGVLFAPGAKVDVGGLLASTLDLSQQDFADGRLHFTSRGGSSGAVVNQGSLKASAGGYLALFGNRVDNQGQMAVDAGSVVLASGRAATVSISGSGLISAVVTPGAQGSIRNSGSISADGGTVVLTAQSAQDIAASLVNNSGVIRANTLVERGGEVWITGDTVASSGHISAAAPNGGDAGRIVLMADLQRGQTSVGGTLDAGAAAGRGGFIETSAAHVNVAAGARVSTMAPQGRTGTWLVDPVDFTIAASGGDMTGAQVAAALAGNNFTVASSQGASGTAGNLNVNDSVGWSANRLTLNAFNNININAPLTGSGTASLALEYGQGALAAGNTAAINVNAAVTLPAGNTFSTRLGSNGTATAYAVVTTLAGLQAIDGTTAALAASYALGADIDASSTAGANGGLGFNPIGNEATSTANGSNSFSGRFDGLGHTVSGLTVSRSTASVGLFASLYNADVRNLQLAGGSVTGSSQVGALAGVAAGSSRISNVLSTTPVALTASSGSADIGGLVGSASGSGALVASQASGTVTAAGTAGAVGGLVGTFAMSGGQTGNRASGNVSGGAYTGGLIGYYDSTAAITDGSYTGAGVSGGAWAGGLVGYMNSSAAITGASSANPLTVATTVTATGTVGGLAGRTNGAVTNVRATGDVTGGGNVGGLIGQAEGNGTVSNATASGRVTGSASTGYVGGLIGYASSGAATATSASGNVSGGTETGGLIGYFNHGSASISNSSASGNVSTSSGGDAGGLLGYSGGGSGALLNSSASGSVTAATTAEGVGGLAGDFRLAGGIVNSSAGSSGSTVSGGTYAGGVVGYYSSATALLTDSAAGTAIAFNGASVSGTSYAGGVVGYSAGTAAITGVRASASVASTGTAGGLAGYMAGNVSGASATGNVSGRSDVGGLVGRLAGSNVTISNSSAGGSVSSTTSSGNVGGLVGYFSGSGSAGITGSSAAGAVSGGGETGGLLGTFNSGTGGVAGASASGPVTGGTGDAGGLIGYASSSGAISGSSASGSVTAAANADTVGGLVGEMRMNGGISGSSAGGTVSGGTYTGGLVGWSSITGAITTSTVTGASVSGGRWVGGLIGYGNSTGAITGISVGNSVTATANAGGLAGYTAGPVTGSSAAGAVTGTDSVGGLVGEATGTVSTSSASGRVMNTSTGSGGSTGGLVGYLHGTASITGATATGNVSGAGDVGGLVGHATGSGSVAGSKATGSVGSSSTSSSSSAGGLAGYSSLTGGVTNSQADGNVTGGYYTGGLVGYYNSAVALVTDAAAGTAITVNASSVSGGAYVGGVVGYSNGTAAITGVTVAANVTGTQTAGGLAGHTGGAVSGSTASGTVRGGGSGSVGGLIGEAAGGSTANVSNSRATGSVSSTGLYGSVGGLVGAFTGGAVSDSSATGAISSGSNAGGLIGYFQGSGGISNSRAEGTVAGGSDSNGTAGGLVGNYRSSGAISGSSYGGTSVAGAYAGGLVGTSSGGSITNGASSASMVTGSTAAGGLLGSGNSTSITGGSVASTVIGGTYAGGLVGYLYGPVSIADASATGAVTGTTNAGGLAGALDGVSVVNGTATGKVVAVSSNVAVGGLVGAFGTNYYYANATASITGSRATGDVVADASSAAVGGLVGAAAGGAIASSSATGKVTGSDSTNNSYSHDTGGLVGRFTTGYGTSADTISNSTASGAVSGRNNVGGLVGSFSGSSISGSSASGAVSGINNVGGLAGYFYGTTVASSRATGSVNASGSSGNAGGLIGSGNTLAAMTSVSASGDVTATGTYMNVGGLVGQLSGLGIVTGSASGKVVGNAGNGSVGGLVGDASLTSSSQIAAAIVDATATGDVVGGVYTGGLIGQFSSGYNYANAQAGGIASSHASGAVTGTTYVGGLVGYFSDSGYSNAFASISSSDASGKVTGSNYVGGLVGTFYGYKGINRSAATGQVVGLGDAYTNNIGGLVGSFYLYDNGSSGASGTNGITSSYASGAVSLANGSALVNYSSSINAGGLVGVLGAGAAATAAVSNAYSTGSVTVNVPTGTFTQLSVGGLVGASSASIARSYASGQVTATGAGAGTRRVGGLLASKTSSTATVSASYWDTTASGQATSAGGTGLTSTQMKQAASFGGLDIASTGSAGKVWRIYEGYTTPLLTSFLTPLSLTLTDASKTYDGSTSFGNAVPGTSSAPVTHPERIQTTATSPNVGSYTVTAAGVYSQQTGYDLTVSGSATLTVTPRPLTLAGVIADKVYDTTRTATVIGTAQPTGLVAGEDLVIDGSVASASFDTKNAGINKTVTVTGITLSDGVRGRAANYTLSGATTTASILPAPLSVGGFVATNRVYDGTTTVALTATGSTSVTGVLGSDDVSANLASVASGTTADKNVGAAKPVTVTGAALSGADAGNYRIVGIDAVTVTITPKPVTVNGLTVPDRIYNASSTFSFNSGSSGVINGAVAGDLLQLASTTLTGTMADKDVGLAKPVAVGGLTLRGPDAANYTALAGTATVTVSPATAYVYVYTTGSGASKVYDGTAAAPNTTVTIIGKQGSDDVASSVTTAAYADKNVAYDSYGNATSKPITVTGAGLVGTDAHNYTLSSYVYNSYGTIAPKPVGVTGVAPINRVYDGTTAVAVNLSNVVVNTAALIAGDQVAVQQPGGSGGLVTGTMADRNVGTAKPVSVPGLALTGTDATNYTLNGSSGVTVTITPKPVTASYTGVNKVYDGSVNAQVQGSSADLLAVDLANNGVYFNSNYYSYYYSNYASFTGSGAKNVGDNKPITISYDSLGGSYASNYTLVNVGQGTASASITPRGVAPSFTGANKVYDGSAAAQVTLNVYNSNIVSGDAITSTQTAVFTGNGAKNVGTGKTVAVSNVALAGADAGNYTLNATTASTSASITAKPVTLSGITAVNRVYDGTLLVAVNAGTVGSSGFIAGDGVQVLQPAGGLQTGTIASKNVGTQRPVTVTGLSLAGADAGNYFIDASASGITVNIAARPLTASYSGVNRVYNGSITAQVTGASADVVAGDSIGFNIANAVFTGPDARNAGTAKPVSFSNATLSGGDAANYALTNASASTTASITAKPITAVYSGGSRVYNGLADVSAAVVSQTGFELIDDVRLIQTAAFRTDGSAGSGKAIDIIGIALQGAQAANYSLVATTAATTGTITAKPIGVTGITAQGRVYDGTRTVAINVANAAIDAAAVLAGDSIAVVLPPNGISTGTMLTKDAGSNKAVQVSGLGITGTAAANYSLVGASGLTVAITARPLTAVYSGVSKVYDGTATAQVSATSADILAGDVGALGISAAGSFSAGKNVGIGKAVLVSGGFLTGTERNNYTLLDPSGSTSASITPRTITASYSGGTRVYDGGVAAPVGGSAAGIISGDSVSFAQTAVFTGSGAKNVGSFKAVAVSGIVLGGDDAANYRLSADSASAYASITAKPITVTGLAGVQASDRIYDGTTTVSVTIPANVTLAPNSNDIVSGDDVAIALPSAGITTGTMANKNAGSNKALAITGLSLSGLDAPNYAVAGTAGVTVNITPKALTASYSGVTRAYDGGVAVAVAGASADIIGGDSVAIGGSGVFTGSGAKNVGSGKAILIGSTSLSGGDAGNYLLANPGGATSGSVTPKGITPVYAGGTRVYDGSANAPVLNQTAGIVSGDVVSFAQDASFTGSGARNVGSGKAVAVSGVSLSGADAGNYALTSTSSNTTAAITPKALRVDGLTGVTAIDRIYDGRTAVSVAVTSSGPIALHQGDIVAGDIVTVTAPPAGTTSGTLLDKAAGNAKPVIVDGLQLGGVDAGNYSIAAATGVTVNIAPKPLSAVYTGISRVYDGTAAATVTGSSIDVVAGDQLSISGSGVFGDGKNVGAAKAIAVLNASLGSADAANYRLLNPTGSAFANVTPRSVIPVFTGGTRVYDGTVAAPVVGTIGAFAGDDVILTQTAVFTGSNARNVGSNKAVRVSNVALTGGDAANYQLDLNPTTITSIDWSSTTASITPRFLSLNGVAGITATDRIYDGTSLVAVTVAATGAISLNTAGVVAGDVVGVTLPNASTTTGTMLDKNAGSNKPVAVTGLALTGADAGNYSITGTGGVTVSIAPKPLTAVYTGQNKVYDGTAAATVVGDSGDIVAGDAVAIAGSGVFSDGKNAGSNKAISVLNAGLTSTDAANYRLLNTIGSAIASITPKAVTASFSGGTRVYDGSVAAPVSGQLSGTVAGDSVGTAASAVFTGSGARNVGSGKAAAVTGISLTGSDAGNYLLGNLLASTTASITPRPLRIDGFTGVTASDRVYDGTTLVAITINGSAPVAPNSSDLVPGDVVTVAPPATGLAAGSMADKNAGSNKPVTVLGLTLGGRDAGNYMASSASGVTVNIAPKALTASYTGQDKVYDGTAAAAVLGSSADMVLGDDLRIAGTGIFSGGKAVGVNKPITVSAITLAGGDAANYSLLNTTGSALASIAPKALDLRYAGASKVYDGTAAAPVSGTALGLVAGDSVSMSQTAVFVGPNGRNVGNDKTVQVSGIALQGADAANYTLLADSAVTSASITPRPLNVFGLSGITAVDRVYDGTSSVQLLASGPLGSAGVDVIAGDDVTVTLPASVNAGTMLDRHAGSGKSVAVTGLTLNGADASNYRITGTAGVSVAIAPRPVALLGVRALDRIYDGSTRVAIDSGAGSVSGLIAGDDVQLRGSGVAGAMADKHAGSNKPVTVTGLALAGGDAGDYVVGSSNPITVTIAPRVLLATAAAADKVYDGTTGATVALRDNRLAGDAIALTSTGASFADKDAGTDKGVAVRGLALAGADAADYVLASDTATATATISRAPALVAANNISKVYGDSAVLSGTAGFSSGMVAGETIGQVTLASAGAAATAGVAGGPYTITISDARGGSFNPANYTLGYHSGLLTVTPRLLTVSANNVVRYADEPNPPSFGISVSVGGLVNGDAVSQTLAQAAPAGSAGAAGGSVFQIVPSGVVFTSGDTANYALRYGNGLLVVLPTPPRVGDVDTAGGAGAGSSDGNVGLAVQVDLADVQRATEALERAAAVVAQPPTDVRSGLPAATLQTAQASAADIGMLLAGDGQRLTLPALQRLPLISFDPQLRQLILGTQPARPGSRQPAPATP